MSKVIDLTGKVFGEWTVISRAENSLKGSARWLCHCSCGNEAVVLSTSLIMGKSTKCNSGIHKTKHKIGEQCGDLTILKYLNNSSWLCQCKCGKEITVSTIQLSSKNICKHEQEAPKKEGIRNLVGQKFGRLTVVKDSKKRTPYGSVIWECECECRKIHNVDSINLIHGHVKSCGCLFKEVSSKVHAKHIEIGSKFGELTVIKELSERGSNSAIRYECLCSCGNTIIIEGRELRRGRTQSCGHINSKGENNIIDYLSTYDIHYKYQYRSHNLYYSSGFKPIFDFAFFDDNGDLLFLLEYNGIQHYKQNNSGWNNKERFEITQKRDKEKIELCKNNNIPLEIISYKDFKNIESILDALISKYYN